MAMAVAVSVAAASHGVHMNGGEGVTSYARNSAPQRRAQERLVPLVEAAVADMWPDSAGAGAGAPRSIGVADLGCSSGPNTLFLVSVAVDAVRRRCGAATAAACCCPPEVRAYLNDLPGNDFNTVFRQVPEFLRQKRAETTEQQAPAVVDAGGDVFVFGAPGSFFGRLFPAGSLHLAMSSFSLHWLSRVPPELATGALVNAGNICAGRTSPASVVDAYARQFRSDLSAFLASRAAEIVAGGWLLVSLKGRSDRDMTSDSCAINDHPTRVLNAMAARGLVDATRLDSYNIPVYDPSAEEVREAVDAEGSFEVVGTESLHPAAACGPAEFARAVRAVHEPMLARHFGDGGVDMDGFVRTAEEIMEEEVRGGRYTGMFVHFVSLRRRGAAPPSSSYSPS